jgi:small subunit ribosomal protein S7
MAGLTNSKVTSSDAEHTEALDDATLEQLFFGGRKSTPPGESALTPAQEETLYREGQIPSPEVAEALNAAAEQAEEELELMEEEVEVEVEEETGVQNPGHKFGLLRGPWPEGMNHKKRYHPVLEQITRLLMRDGKLSAAQRVCTSKQCACN